MSKLKLSFINPPYADWSLCSLNTFLYMQSHYSRNGLYKDQVEWLDPPIRWNEYKTTADIIKEIDKADVVLFSSYIWNCEICDEIASKLKDKIKILGGPHIGKYDEELMSQRLDLYDYILQATKPGEDFIENFLNIYFQNNGIVDPEKLPWEIRSSVTKNKYNFSAINYSIYEDHFDKFKELSNYADLHNLEKYISFESTRGCPYQCVFCEWGGGTGTKVSKKSLELIDRDFKAIQKAGYQNVYLNDANFGMLFDRDMKMYELALQHKIHLRDISTVKTRDIARRKKIIDSCDDILSKYNNVIETFETPPMIPTVSIQSISDLAMKVSKRVDLSINEKIELSEYIYSKNRSGRDIELILGMPGSTIEDFYEEYNLIWNFRPNIENIKYSSWDSLRHDYMILPDSELASPGYLEQHGIQKVKVYVKEFDETGEKNNTNLYNKKPISFYTVSSCDSYTSEEYIQMWLMNKCGVFLLRDYYNDQYQKLMSPSQFIKYSKEIIYGLNEIKPIIEYAKILFNPNTGVMCINELEDGTRIQERINQILYKNDFLNMLITHKLFEVHDV